MIGFLPIYVSEDTDINVDKWNRLMTQLRDLLDTSVLIKKVNTLPEGGNLDIVFNDTDKKLYIYRQNQWESIDGSG